MRSAIARLALLLTLGLPALHAQLSYPGLTRIFTFPTLNAHLAMSVYIDDSDNCWEILYGVEGELFGNPNLTTAEVSIVGDGPKPAAPELAGLCATALAAKAGLSPSSFSRSSGRKTQIRLAETHASSASSADQIWIASGTPTPSAPNTSGGVYVIDPNTFDVVASISLPGTIASSPTALASNHAGTYMYAVISAPAGTTTGSATIVAINMSTYSIAQTINLPSGVNPGIPALSANDRYLYVPNAASAGGVLAIDTQNPSSITTIATTVTSPQSSQPSAVAQAAVTPDGELLFAWGSYDLFVIDTTSGQQIGQILLPAEEGGLFLQNQQQTGTNYFAIDPTGSRIYAFANYGSGPSNTWTGYLHVYNTASLSLVSSKMLGQDVDLDSIALSPDGSTIFVNAFVYADGQNPIFLVDTQSLAVAQANLSAPPLSQSDTGLWQTLLMVLQ